MLSKLNVFFGFSFQAGFAPFHAVADEGDDRADEKVSIKTQKAPNDHAGKPETARKVRLENKVEGKLACACVARGGDKGNGRV